jgi:hypothetical protein
MIKSMAFSLFSFDSPIVMVNAERWYRKMLDSSNSMYLTRLSREISSLCWPADLYLGG